MPDFRDAAVQESETLLAQFRGVNLADKGISYCIRAESDGPNSLHKARTQTIWVAVIGIAGIVIGGIIAFISKRQGLGAPGENQRLMLMGIFSGGGFALIGGHLIRQRLITRRRVVRRLGGAMPQGVATSSVGVENAQTHHVGKLWPEDTAIVLLIEEKRYVQIEGVSHRYLIRADDTESVTLTGGSEHSNYAIHVAYRIGQTRLELSLSPDQLLKQIGWQLSGRIPALFDQVKRCLRK